MMPREPAGSDGLLLHGTTILAVRRDGRSAIAGDGQVTLGATVVKHGARKIRRLHNGQVLAGYAGLESLKLGRGGDRQRADFLELDPHTVARVRQQLLAQDVEVDRARRAGAGRKPVEKKRPK